MKTTLNKRRRLESQDVRGPSPRSGTKSEARPRASTASPLLWTAKGRRHPRSPPRRRMRRMTRKMRKMKIERKLWIPQRRRQRCRMARTRKAIRLPNVLCMLTQMAKMTAHQTPRAAALPAPHPPPPPRPHPPRPLHPLSPPLKMKRKRSGQQPFPQPPRPPEKSQCPRQHLWRCQCRKGLQAPQSHPCPNRRRLQQGLQAPRRSHPPVRLCVPQNHLLGPRPLPHAPMSVPLLPSPSCPHPRNAGKLSPSLPSRWCQPRSPLQPHRRRPSFPAQPPARLPGAWSGPSATCPWTTHLWSRVGPRRCPEEAGAGLEAEAASPRKRRLSQGQRWTWRSWPTWP
uniref:Alternative protein SETD1A n=1 Tax=Homo sapiens TaxID=9606 RepID=L0R6N9_HUMAN|nr:alternative protein SETD1A [Homo sapiens]